jgi:hypothetical protein
MGGTNYGRGEKNLEIKGVKVLASELQKKNEIMEKVRNTGKVCWSRKIRQGNRRVWEKTKSVFGSKLLQMNNMFDLFGNLNSNDPFMGVKIISCRIFEHFATKTRIQYLCS